MVGINNGVFKLLKEEFGLDNLILIRCICHSLQLAISAATKETIPRNIEFMLKETHNWFSCSSKRQLQYSKLFQAINGGKTPLKIPQLSATRWISIEPVVKKILDQWVELHLHFSIVRRYKLFDK